jgi:hypothetical protein
MPRPKLDKNFLESLRTGIAAIETGGVKDPYSSPAGDANKDGKPDSTAMGKYQFLKSYWWDKKGTGGKINGFKEFAHGKEDLYGEVKSWEDVKGNKALQEAYFAYYAENHLIPKAKAAIAKGNPLNLTLGQAIAVIHKNGHGAGTKAITSGKLNPKTETNVSDAKYLKTFDEAIQKNGLKDMTAKEYIKKEVEAGAEISHEEKRIIKTSEERLNELIEKDKNLTKLYDDGVTNDIIEEKRAELFKQVKAEGLTAEFDEYTNDFNQKATAQKELLELIAGAETDMLDKPGTSNDQLKQIRLPYGDVEKMEKLKEQFPSLSKYMHIQKDDGLARIVINQRRSPHGGVETKSIEGFFGEFNKMNKEAFGEDYQPITNKQLKEGWNDGVGNVWDTFKGSVKNITRKLHGQVPIMPGKVDAGNTSSYKVEQRPKIDWTKVEVSVPEERIVRDDDTKVSDAERKKALQGHVIGDIIAEEEANKKAESKEDTGEDANALDKMVNDHLGLASVGNGKAAYDAKDMKRELPIDAVAGMALGLIGNEQAKNADIPLREEQVSEAFRSYQAELAKMSKQGLPVEVEAAMKNQLAEAYQGGLNNIVNASAGNRATVLGNQGQLETARNKGLVSIQLADYEAKQKAFAQYGEALSYVEEFNSRRDIANHGIKYNEAKTRQVEGKELAAAGFAKLTDAIKYDKENGPGSANAMYKSYLMQQMFGFDPNKKDDGTGNVPGTKSHFDKQVALAKEKNDKALSFSETVQTLNEGAKEVMNKFAQQNGGLEGGMQLAEYLKNNPSLDYSKLSLENIDQALLKGDMGLLNVDRQTAVNAPKMPVNDAGTPNEATGLLGTETKFPSGNGNVYDAIQAEEKKMRDSWAPGKGFLVMPESKEEPTQEDLGMLGGGYFEHEVEQENKPMGLASNI